jgi:probable H4MPT-linked C1 transfer pathway protein
MIGIDVGGANLKVVDGDGVHIHSCPLFSGAPLVPLLSPYRTSPDTPAAVVMSGELADCFSNKKEGIGFIVRVVQEVFPRAVFYGTDAEFHTTAVPQLAAANWLASADYLRTSFPGAVLVDVGSTTTDIIPLSRFDDLKGLTDLKRLQKGYLLYTGMLRTSIPTLLRIVVLDGIPTPLSTEFFATSADAHLVLGHITAEQYSWDTPDHREKTHTAAMRRLARVVCADLEEIGEAGALRIAEQFWDVQRALVCDKVRKVMAAAGTTDVVTAGIGSALFAQELGAIDLSEELGEAADALPAFAVRELARGSAFFVRHPMLRRG